MKREKWEKRAAQSDLNKEIQLEVLLELLQGIVTVSTEVVGVQVEKSEWTIQDWEVIGCEGVRFLGFVYE